MDYEINLNRYLDVVATYGKRYYRQGFLNTMSYEINLNRYLDVVATYGKRYYHPGF